MPLVPITYFCHFLPSTLIVLIILVTGVAIRHGDSSCCPILRSPRLRHGEILMFSLSREVRHVSVGLVPLSWGSPHRCWPGSIVLRSAAFPYGWHCCCGPQYTRVGPVSLPWGPLFRCWATPFHINLTASASCPHPSMRGRAYNELDTGSYLKSNVFLSVKDDSIANSHVYPFCGMPEVKMTPER